MTINRYDVRYFGRTASIERTAVGKL